MSNKDQHAFPQSQEMWGGLTKREWFAGMAMQGILAGDRISNLETVTKESYKQADAMLAESEKAEFASKQMEGLK